MEGQRRSGYGDPRDARGGKTNRPDSTSDGAFTSNDLSGVERGGASCLIVCVEIRHSIRRCKVFGHSTLIQKVVSKGPGKAGHSPSTPLFYCNRRTFQSACAILKNSDSSKLRKIAATENHRKDCAVRSFEQSPHRSAHQLDHRGIIMSHEP